MISATDRKLMDSQALAAQQAYRALMTVARLRLRELQRDLRNSHTAAQVQALNEEIRLTEQAIRMGERIG
jgi:hypothetical protein